VGKEAPEHQNQREKSFDKGGVNWGGGVMFPGIFVGFCVKSWCTKGIWAGRSSQVRVSPKRGGGLWGNIYVEQWKENRKRSIKCQSDNLSGCVVTGVCLMLRLSSVK